MERSKVWLLIRDIKDSVRELPPPTPRWALPAPEAEMCAQEGTIEKSSKLNNQSERLARQSRESREELDQEAHLRWK